MVENCNASRQFCYNLSHLLGPAREETHEIDGGVNLALAVLAEAPVDLVLVAEIQDVVEELVPDIYLLLGSVRAEAVAWSGIVHFASSPGVQSNASLCN